MYKFNQGGERPLHENYKTLKKKTKNLEEIN
jgi:hypothetical protein